MQKLVLLAVNKCDMSGYRTSCVYTLRAKFKTVTKSVPKDDEFYHRHQTFRLIFHSLYTSLNES